jgi:hypothetical protein
VDSVLAWAIALLVATIILLLLLAAGPGGLLS